MVLGANATTMAAIDSRLLRLQGILEAWAGWQAAYSPRLGYAPKSAGLESGYVSQTFDEMCDSADDYALKAVDAAVDDLLPALRAALYRRYLSAVFRLHRMSYEEALSQAHDELLVRLPRKGVCV